MTELFYPYRRNTNPFLNRFSPFASPKCLSEARGEGCFADTHFGYAWDVEIRDGDAVYGQTEDFVPGPLDDYGTGEFTRLPYRRIPRIKVTSLEALMRFVTSAISQRNGVHRMWRGQGSEHVVNRPAADRLKLYGSVDVHEPSLVPSASRPKAQRFEEYMEAWLALVDVYIEERLSGLSAIYSEATMAGLREEADFWRKSYNFKLWSFAAAQHYGLPSTGLDLSTDINVALFFALYKFTISDGWADIARVGADARPVIYFMGVFESDLLPDEKIGPVWLQTKRAKAQSAHFFGTAWGDASNKAAERIIAVFELHGHETWALPELRSKLFPPKAEDPFGKFLSSVPSRFPAILDQVPVHRVYHWT